MKFVKKLSLATEEELNRELNSSSNRRYAVRIHCILLSNQGYKIKEITKILSKHRESISTWIDKWEEKGLEGLKDAPRSGRPPILEAEKKKEVLDLMSQQTNYAQRIDILLALLYKELKISISKKSFKRWLKSEGFSWRRIRKSLKKFRNEAAFRAFYRRLQSLKFREDNGTMDLYFFDESGFSLTPEVPYAWQDKKAPLEVSTKRSTRFNVAGFMNRHGDLQSFIFEGSITSEVVVACFDYFCDYIRAGKTAEHNSVILVDNAPPHRSTLFQSRIKEWRAKGMYVEFLPAYSPELNYIEILWNQIKYRWLEMDAYTSKDQLSKSIEYILKNYGGEFKVEFKKTAA